MNKFLDSIIFDNPIRSYLAVFGLILFLLIFKRWVSRYVASLLYVLIHRRWKSIEKIEFLALIIKPLGWFITITISVFAIDKLNFPAQLQFKIYGEPFDEIVQKIGSSLIVLYFTLFLIRFINFVSLIFEHKTRETADKADDQLVIFFRDFLKVIAGIFGILLIIKVGFNQDIGAMLTGLSIVGAALALAAKESLENLIASFIIFFDKPFYTGDFLKVNSISGTVEHIGLRSTRIRTPEQTLVTVPNKQMVDSAVDNISNLVKRRVVLNLDFAIKTSSEDIDAFIQFAKHELTERADVITGFSVYLTDISKTGLLVRIEFFTIPFSYADYCMVRQSVNFALKKEIEAKKLELSATAGEVNIFNAPEPPKSNPII